MDDMKPPALVTQAEYARYRNVSQGRISHLKAEGRIVMVDGLVDVAASDANLGPIDNAAALPAFAPTSDLARAQLRLAEAQADLAEMKLAENAGQLVDKAELDGVIERAIGPLLDQLERLQSVLPEKIIRLRTEREIGVVIADAIDEVRRHFCANLEREAGALDKQLPAQPE
jgi:phage terminase Nu1 subunit (DNA packaging protein)